MNKMENIFYLVKATIAGFISSIIVYFDPVAGKLESLLALFALNFFIGFITGKVKNGEAFNLKKFKECFSWAALILVIICAFYFIGERNGNQSETIECLRIAILVAIWAFGTNIFRNLCDLSEQNQPVHSFFYACYYWLSFDFVKRIPFLEKLTYKAKADEEQDEHHHHHKTEDHERD